MIKIYLVFVLVIYIHASIFLQHKEVYSDIFMPVILVGEQGMVVEAQKAMEEIEALKKVATAMFTELYYLHSFTSQLWTLIFIL